MTAAQAAPVRTAAEQNRQTARFWEAAAASWTATRGIPSKPAWGLFDVPEAELDILGAVEGKDALVLGCGIGDRVVPLAERGARVTGLDFSPAMLEATRQATNGLAVRLVEADALAVPLPSESFDVVVSDHGALLYVDPREAVPEAARLLRPGALLVVCGPTPWCAFEHWGHERATADYLSMGRHDDGRTVRFCLPYGEQVRVFRDSGLTLERLVELRPPVGLMADSRPLEQIWITRKEPAEPRP